MIDYFNDDKVKEALNVQNYTNLWKPCVGGDNGQNANYTIDPNGTQWVYEELKGMTRMLHFSGDKDGAVPTDGTVNWIETMNMTTSQPW